MNESLMRIMSDLSMKIRVLREFSASNTVKPQGFTERERLAMELIERWAPLTESEVGDILGLATSSTTELVKKLVASEAVEKLKAGAQSRDKREKPLRITQTGRQVLETARADAADLYESLLKDCKQDELRALEICYQKMQETIDRLISRRVFGGYDPRFLAKQSTHKSE